ncbi:MAG: single-stranded DNA-binding protein [Alphaproteobacteria bacterium]|nr:single-stranded DNA-binding protein [Alphaproteobacteria bacterium]
MFQQVIIMGYLGNDPEIRSTGNGSKVANFSVATSEKYKDKPSGEMREMTEWHRVAIWNEHLVKVVEDYVKKGSPVMITGQLKTRKWTDSHNIERYTTEVVIGRFKGELKLLPNPNRDSSGASNGNGSGNGNGGQRQQRQQSAPQGGGGQHGGWDEPDSDGDDIPF